MRKYPNKKQAVAAPQLHWQTGDYATRQVITFHVPYPFLLLCKLWETTPKELLGDFMEALGHTSFKREKHDGARECLVQYALTMGYGQQHYTKEDMLQTFRELDAVGMLWPDGADRKMIEFHAQWRNAYYDWWFEKWYGKYQRQL